MNHWEGRAQVVQSGEVLMHNHESFDTNFILRRLEFISDKYFRNIYYQVYDNIGSILHLSCWAKLWILIFLLQA